MPVTVIPDAAATRPSKQKQKNRQSTEGTHALKWNEDAVKPLLDSSDDSIQLPGSRGNEVGCYMTAQDASRGQAYVLGLRPGPEHEGENSTIDDRHQFY